MYVVLTMVSVPAVWFLSMMTCLTVEVSSEKLLTITRLMAMSYVGEDVVDSVEVSMPMSAKTVVNMVNSVRMPLHTCCLTFVILLCPVLSLCIRGLSMLEQDVRFSKLSLLVNVLLQGALLLLIALNVIRVTGCAWLSVTVLVSMPAMWKNVCAARLGKHRGVLRDSFRSTCEPPSSMCVVTFRGMRRILIGVMNIELFGTSLVWLALLLSAQKYPAVRLHDIGFMEEVWLFLTVFELMSFPTFPLSSSTVDLF